jgi:hypothetical protein
MTIPLSALKGLLFDWVETATELDNGQIIFSYQNRPEPSGPYFLINPVINITRIGMDEENPATGADLGKIEVVSRRYVSVSLHCFGATALELMSAVQDASNRPSVYLTFNAEGMGLQCGAVKDLSGLKGARFEGRAQMDVRVTCGSSFIDDLGWFDTVSGTSTINEIETEFTVQGD